MLKLFRPVSRNPIAWIRFLLFVPVFVILWSLFVAIYILLLPVVIVWCYFGMRSFDRKAGVFSERGIHFPKAYSRITIAWPDIREVVREREPKLSFYLIICAAAEPARNYILSRTPDDDSFERELRDRGIPFRVSDWLNRAASERL